MIGLMSVVIDYSVSVVDDFCCGYVLSSSVCDSGVSGFVIVFCRICVVSSVGRFGVILYSYDVNMNSRIDVMNRCIWLKCCVS